MAQGDGTSGERGAADDASGDPPAAPAPSPDDAARPAREGVAVIVVHGVADQKPGDTMASVVELLTVSSPDGARYEAIDAQEFVLRVPPLAPDAYAADRATHDLPASGSVTQSFRSDFQRESTAPAAARTAAAGAGADPTDDADRGLEFTRYLLGRGIEHGMRDEAFASKRIRLVRAKGDERTRVDVYEMYWADLSRLSGALPRIVSELVTLIFRLSRLGRDTVAEASFHVRRSGASRSRAWRPLAALQAVLDWSFVHLLAHWFGQLLMLGLLTIVFGLAKDGSVPAFVGGIDLVTTAGAALGIVGVLATVYFSMGRAHPTGITASMALAAAGVTMALAPGAAAWLFAAVALAITTAAYAWILRAVDRRFPLVFATGIACWVVVLALAAWSVHPVATLQSPWSTVVWFGIAGFEWALWFIKWWWMVAAVLILPWIALTTAIAFHRHFEERASAATGRLGLVLSLALFVVMGMALWAALEEPLELAVASTCYEPAVFVAPIPACDAGCDPTPTVTVMRCVRPLVDASSFLADRFRASTMTFSAIAVLLLSVIVFLVATILPSVLAELGWTSSRQTSESRRLGRWLTSAYRALDTAVLLFIVAAGLVVCAAVLDWSGFAPAALHRLVGVVQQAEDDYSRSLLHWFVIPAASVFAALSVFGGTLSKLAPGVRGPLDAALDVDNFLREFPAHAIPRARIFARYDALMRRIRSERYERVVIVSHSQGTVISAEYLRFVSSTSTARVQPDRVTRMQDDDHAGCPVRLLTLGCPLRQLYASRFPTLYQWILNVDGRPIGPRARDIGASIWVNAFTSGDYVGRWLWSSGAKSLRRFHPLIDRVRRPTLGRELAYDTFAPMPPAPRSIGRIHEYETCIGFGAHTHYFEPGQTIVADMIDRLIRP